MNGCAAYTEVCHEGTGSASGYSVCWDSIGGIGKVEGTKCGPVLATLLFGSGPCDYPFTSSNTCTTICCCLCCTSLLLSLPLLMLPLPLLPCLCCSLQPARQQQTHRHAADTQGSLQFSLWLCELSPRARLAGQYKPDIRFMLLALWITAGFASSPKLLAAVGELLARVKLVDLVLILECLHCVFVMAV